MSAYREQKTELDNTDALIGALEEMGFHPEYHEEGAPLYGFQGDFRTADGQGHTKDPDKAMKAHIILRRKEVGSSSNDIGFVKDKDGKYVAIVSDYDRGRHGDQWLDKVKRLHADKKIRAIARKQGLRFVRETEVKGEKKLIFEQA